MCLLFYAAGYHRDLHVLTHSCPTRRFSDRLRSPVGERTGTRRYHYSRFAKAPHLGKLGQFLGRAPAVRAARHLTDREMHPAKRHQHEQEKQREAACPDAGKIEKHTEGDGKDEAPQSSDHPHSPANLADMVRVIDGDVLEHRGLAQAHAEAEDRSEAHTSE